MTNSHIQTARVASAISLTIITPTPTLTASMKNNFKVIGRQASWLIVWTNTKQPVPTNLDSSRLQIIRYPQKYLPIRDFSRLRNWAIAKVKTRWSLFLDSDETIDQQSWRKIKQLLKQNRPLVNGYLLKRQDIFLGRPLKYGETGQIYLLRLGKTEFMRYQRVVHEIAGVDGMTDKTEILIQHFAHKNIKQFLTKIFNYAQLEANQRHTWRLVLWLQLLFYPLGKFVNNYFIKLGFLDGMRGLVYASLMSLHSLLVRIYQLEK